MAHSPHRSLRNGFSAATLQQGPENGNRNLARVIDEAAAPRLPDRARATSNQMESFDWIKLRAK
jgi:hypothetical protein